MTQRILLIEDDDNIRNELSQALENEIQGLVAEAYPSANNPSLANFRSRPEGYLALITDWALPSDFQGSDVVREARRLNPSLFIIAFTGHVQGIGPEAIQKGADLYLNKPIDPAELVGAIKNLAKQDGAFHNIAQTVQTLLKSSQVFVWRYHEKQRTFTLDAWADPNDITDEDRNLTLLSDNVRLRKVLNKDEPVWIRNLQHPICYHTDEFANRHSQWHTLISVPLRCQGELIGLLESYTSYPLDWGGTLKQQGVPKMLLTFVNKSAEVIYLTDQARKNHELINMSNQLAETPNLEKVTAAILTKGVQLLNADVGWIYVRNFEKDKLHLVSPTIHLKKPVRKWLRMNETLVGRAGQEGIVQYIKDTDVSFAIEPLPTDGIHSQVAIPLRLADLTIGVMVLGSRFANAFSEGDFNLMRSFASLASQALDQAKLRSHLGEMGKSATKNTQQLAEKIVTAAQDLTGKASALWLLDESTNLLTIQAAQGISERFQNEARIHYTGKVDSLIAKTFSTGKTETYQNMGSQNAPQDIQLLQIGLREGWESILVVPLFDSETKPLGALTLHGRLAGQFSDQEVVSLENFASQAATAIENTRRRDSLFRLVKSGQLTVRNVTDETKVLKQFVKMVCELTDAPCAVIYPYNPEQEVFFDVDKIVVHGLLGLREEIQAKPDQNSLTSIILHTGQYVVDDVDQKELPPILSFAGDPPDILELMHQEQFVEREQVKAFIGISLSASGISSADDEEEMGVMYINYRTPHHFTPSEIELIHLFAQQAANLIHAARLYAHQEEQNKINQMLLVASQNLAQVGNREGVLKIVLDEAFKLVGKTTGMIISIEKGETLNIISHRGLTRAQVLGFNRAKNNARIGTFGIVMSTGKIFESSDTSVEPVIKNLGLPIPPQLTNLPIKAEGKIKALLVLDKAAFNPRIRNALLTLSEIAGTALDKVLAYQERNQQLDALQQIIDAMETSTNPLGVILQQAVELFSADYGSIGLSIAAARELIFGTHWEKNQLLLGEQVPEDKRRNSFDKGVTGYVARKRETYRINNVGEEPLYMPWYADTQSELTVPLIDSRDNLIGVLNLESIIPDAFSAADQALCERLARMAAVAIEKSELLRVTRLLQDAIKNLEKVQTATTLQSALRQVVQGVVNILGDKTCSASINLFDEKESRFLPTMVAVGEMQDELVRVPPRPKNGLGAYVMGTSTPVYYEDVHQKQKEGTPQISERLIRLGVCSFAALPLIHKYHKLGALFIHHKGPLTFSPDLRQILELYAGQAAIAINDAQSIWLGAALQRIQDASSSKPLPEFLELAVREAAKIMQVEYGELWLKQPGGSLRLAAFHKPEHVTISETQRTILSGTPSINMQVLENQVPRVVRQIEEAKNEFLKIYPEAQSSITVPLIYQNETIGTFNLESRLPDTFSEQDIPRLRRFAIPTAIAIHTANLLQSEREQKRQTEALREIAQSLNAVSDHKAIIEQVWQHLPRVLEFNNASIQTIRGDRRKIEASTTATTRPELLCNISEDPLIQGIVREKKPRVLSNVADEPLWKVFEETKNVKSWMGIPLVVNDQVIGLLTLDHDQPGTYTETSGQLAMAFASVVAAAIHRSQQDQALIAINHLSQELLKQDETPESIERLLQLIADKAYEVLQADTIQVLEYDQARKVFRATPFSADKLIVPFTPRPITPDDIAYNLITRETAWYVPDARSEELFRAPFTKDRDNLPQERFTVREKIISSAIVPLRSGSETVGLLYVNYRSQQAFDIGQKTVIELFASQAASAIENARLFEKQDLANKRLQAVVQISQKLASIIDKDEKFILKSVLEEIPTQTQPIMDINNMFVALYNGAEDEVSFALAYVNGQEIKINTTAHLGWGPRRHGNGMVEEVIRQRRPILIQTQAEGEAWYQNHTNSINTTFASWVGVPMLAGEQVLGVIATYHKTEEYKYDKNDVEVLNTMTHSIAFAIQNARLVRERNQRIQELTQLTELGLNLGNFPETHKEQ
jgi:GAF domain-containing protein/DNA-binding response OmpR family regulator